MTSFHDRRDAGRQLARRLEGYRRDPDVIVLGLPRGGVPVAFEVAQALHAPLDIFVVRKLGAPGHEEYAIGAIASGGVRVLNDAAVRYLHVSDEALDRIAEREGRELDRRERAYRGDRAAHDLQGKTVILVDDGLATGASMRAAVEAVRRKEPARVVVAVPVGARDTCQEFTRIADEVVCLSQPEPFHAVGLWYTRFDQTSDREVQELLSNAPQGRNA